MTRRILMCVLLLLLLASTPGFAASKEVIELQTQVQELQDELGRMQQSFDETMGLMRNLVEQQTDTINRVQASIQILHEVLTQQQVDAGQRADQVSGQVQALSDSLDEVGAKLAKASKEVDQFASQGQNIALPAAATSQPQAPPSDVLYNNALGDYYAGKLEIASQEFGDYLKYYSTTEQAGDAQFDLAEIEYTQGNFSAAVGDYDKVLEQYPGGAKTATAQLKKGLAFIHLGQQDAAIRELKSVIERYPQSVEASEARTQLHKLKPSARISAKGTLR